MYQNILVAIDDIESSGLAITNAKNLAKATGAAVTLLHVVSPPNPLVVHDEHVAGVRASDDVVEFAQHDETALVEAQRASLQETANLLAADGIIASAEVITGNAHTKIVQTVNDTGADLVIISTHGRRGVSRAILGSVADEVFHDVDVPVLVVRRS